MIWLIWRQHRKQLLVAAVGLAVLAAVLVPTGLLLRHAFADAGLPACQQAAGTAQMVGRLGETCNTALARFNRTYQSYSAAAVLLAVVPLLVGLFWGAPLVAREIEQGTHRLVWTQGISRRRWAVAKIGFVATAALLVSAVYGLGVSWWWTPLNTAGQSRFGPLAFDVQGAVPIGYTLFAVALGIFAGTVWPRVLSAMGVTVAGYVGVRVGLALLARPRYLPAREVTYPVQNTVLEPNPWLANWVQSVGVRDASGRMVAEGAEIACPPNASGPGGGCGSGLGVGPGAYNWQQLQPADRFWLFQGVETGIFVALALVLVAVAVHRVRRLT